MYHFVENLKSSVGICGKPILAGQAKTLKKYRSTCPNCLSIIKQDCKDVSPLPADEKSPELSPTVGDAIQAEPKILPFPSNTAAMRVSYDAIKASLNEQELTAADNLHRDFMARLASCDVKVKAVVALSLILKTPEAK